MMDLPDLLLPFKERRAWRVSLISDSQIHLCFSLFFGLVSIKKCRTNENSIGLGKIARTGK
jgi:hypothetical protein